LKATTTTTTATTTVATTTTTSTKTAEVIEKIRIIEEFDDSLNTYSNVFHNQGCIKSLDYNDVVDV
jgi:hypothetical protein